jgi:hypothetical protein
LKYAREVMELMGAYPGRDFRMGEIVRYVRNGKEQTTKERSAMNVGVHRVLRELEASGSITVKRTTTNGSFSLYAWKTIT